MQSVPPIHTDPSQMPSVSLSNRTLSESMVPHMARSWREIELSEAGSLQILIN